jgi:hypothetical protein
MNWRAALTVLLLPVIAPAAELRHLDVDYEDGVYSMDSTAWFDASQSAMFAVLSDWDLSTTFSSVIVESRDIEPDEAGRDGYYVRVRGCILLFCKTAERQGYVERTPEVRIVASADPRRSDFKLCDERWEFNSDGGGTVVRYTLRMTPDFWVPPVFGPYFIKSRMRGGGTAALDRIEKAAQEWTAAQ